MRFQPNNKIRCDVHEVTDITKLATPPFLADHYNMQTTDLFVTAILSIICNYLYRANMYHKVFAVGFYLFPMLNFT